MGVVIGIVFNYGVLLSTVVVILSSLRSYARCEIGMVFIYGVLLVLRWRSYSRCEIGIVFN